MISIRNALALLALSAAYAGCWALAARARRRPAALRALSASGCTRLALYIGGDSYDYPLTWITPMNQW